MTTIGLAREAGFVEYELEDYTQSGYDIRYERLVELARADEREECAKVCEEEGLLWGRRYATAIRARGNTWL